MIKYILILTSIIFSFNALADLDKRFVKKRMMRLTREGKGPTP